MRLIIHADLDCFYCQVEQVRLKLDSSQPIAVQQWQGLIAVNYAARAAGVKRHCRVEEAREMCPSLRLVHVATFALNDPDLKPKYHNAPMPATHKVDLSPYRQASAKIFQIFKRMAKHVQKASVDEAYMDVTDEVEVLLEQRFPDWQHCSVKQVTHHLSWATLGVVIEDQNSSQEVTWDDVRMMLAAEKALDIRQAVFNELGYTVSAGVAPNLTLAKICSAMNKPNQQTVLRPSVVKSFMYTLPFQKIRMMGGKLGDEIELSLGAETAGDVWRYSLDELQKKFNNDTGKWIYDICRGECNDVVQDRDVSKSMLSAKSLRPPATSMAQLEPWLAILCAELFDRISEESQCNKRWPKSVIFHWKSVSMKSEKSRSAPVPRKSFLSESAVLLSIIKTTLADVKASLFPCDRVCVSCTGFEEADNTPTIQSFFAKRLPQKDSIKPSVKPNLATPTQYSFNENIADAWPPALSSPMLRNMNLMSTPMMDPTTPSRPLNLIEFSSPLLEKHIIHCSICGQAMFEDEPEVIREHADFHAALDLSKRPQTSADSDIIIIDSDDGFDNLEQEAPFSKPMNLASVVISPCTVCGKPLAKEYMAEHMDWHVAMDVSRTMKREAMKEALALKELQHQKSRVQVSKSGPSKSLNRKASKKSSSKIQFSSSAMPNFFAKQQ